VSPAAATCMHTLESWCSEAIGELGGSSRDATANVGGYELRLGLQASQRDLHPRRTYPSQERKSTAVWSLVG